MKTQTNKLFLLISSKNIFDEPEDHADYHPLPEDERPGGFNWGERPNAPPENQNQDQNNQ